MNVKGSKITLSKSAKRVAARKIDNNQCRSFIKSELDAERSAFMAKFAKPSRKPVTGE